MQNIANIEDVPGITQIVMKAIGITFALGFLQ